MRLSPLLLISFTTSAITSPLLASVNSSNPSSNPLLEEVFISGKSYGNTINSSPFGVTPADSAQILKALPGADVNANGPLTGISHYRGVFGARVNTQIEGVNMLTGGPNWMDPPLHYAPSLWIETVELHRGISPVSKGMNYINGSINAKLKKIKPNDSANWDFNGELGAQYSTNNDGIGLGIIAGGARENTAIWTRILTEQADDQTFPSGDISPSEYGRSRVDFGGEYQWGDQILSGYIGRNETGKTGTPALPMDIMYIDTDIANLTYGYQINQLSINASIHSSNVEHEMNNFSLRPAPPLPMRFRSTLAKGDALSTKFDFSYSLKGQSTPSWYWGIESKNSEHSATIRNPNNAMFFVNNFNEAKLELLSAYIEQKTQLLDKWLIDTGIRFTKAKNSSGSVASSMAMMNLNVRELKDRFNQANKDNTDNLFDWHLINTLQLEKTKERSQSLILALSRKSRTASYQERYLWLPMQATAGLADGNTYIGNLNLDPEVAHQFELGYDLSSNHFEISPRLFIQSIHDYIQGTKTTNAQAIMISNMMGSAKPPLQFTNIDAKIYGFDLLARFDVTQNIRIEATAQWIEGQQTDGKEDNLYRISPPKIGLALLTQLERSAYGVKLTGVKKQEKVAKFNEEKPTTGYGLVDVFAEYRVNSQLNFALSVDNLFDREYQDHLGGYNRAKQSDIEIGERLKSLGRNVQARLNYQF